MKMQPRRSRGPHEAILALLCWLLGSLVTALVVHRVLEAAERGAAGAYAEHEHGALLPASLAAATIAIALSLGVVARAAGRQAGSDPLVVLAKRLRGGSFHLPSLALGLGGGFTLVAMECCEQAASGHAANFAGALGGNVWFGAGLIALVAIAIVALARTSAHALLETAVRAARILVAFATRVLLPDASDGSLRRCASRPQRATLPICLTRSIGLRAPPASI